MDDIKYVINYDYPSCSEDYVHRIGRTGRCDKKGTAYTFFTQNNAKQAHELIEVLKEANQEVSSNLFELASQSYRYGKNVRKRYGGYGGGYGGNRYGGGGFGGGRRPYGGGSSSFNGNSNGHSDGLKRKWDSEFDSSKRFRPSYNGTSNGSSSRFGPPNGSAVPPPPPPAATSNGDRYNNFG